MPEMSENQYFGDGKETNDFGQIIATVSSEENLEHMIQSFGSTRPQLRFMNHLPDLIYTGLPISGEEGTSLMVALIDAFTGNVVKNGSEASAKVELLLIDKTFNKNDTEDWTVDEFKAHILAGRPGKTPSLGGDTYFNLIEGVGSVGKIYFRHTKHPLPKMELRLGAIITDCPFRTRIRGATIGPFTLKDRRGMNKKHYPLKLTDPVWRLENIGKSGPFHRKLSMANITTVQNFLAEYTLNPQRLQNILGKSMSAKKLKAAAYHAQTCSHGIKEFVDLSPMSRQNPYVEISSLLETTHASIQMFSDTKEIAEATTPAKIWEVTVDDVDDMFPESEKAYDSFLVDEHQWHLDSTATLTGAFCEDENLEFLDPFYPLQTADFSPTDPPQNLVAVESEVKKKLFIFFIASKWLLKIYRKRNANQIRSL